MSIPFSYHLFHVPTQKHYYGIRYARGCCPSDLWTKYFTSSKIVKELIREYGRDSFIATVRRRFSCQKDAILWEHKVLTRLGAANRPDWINRHNGGKKFKGPVKHTDEAKRKIGAKQTGVPKTPEQRMKMRLSAQRDRKLRQERGWKMPRSGVDKATQWKKKNHDQFYTPARNAKIAESKKGTKRHYLPDGSFIMRRD